MRGIESSDRVVVCVVRCTDTEARDTEAMAPWRACDALHATATVRDRDATLPGNGDTPRAEAPRRVGDVGYIGDASYIFDVGDRRARFDRPTARLGPRA